jgi:Rha family phage regulatory protein
MQHKIVIVSIRDIISSAENSAQYYILILSSYKNATGRELPMCIITRDGFTLLVMGFTGKKALLN